MPVDIAALRSEVANDPLAIGYAPFRNGINDSKVADLLNTVRAGAGFRVDRPNVPASEVFEAIAPLEMAAVVSADLQRLQLLLHMGEVNLAGVNTRAILAACFPVGSVTRTNLIALQKRQGSRAEALFGFGVVVTSGDIASAR